MILSVELCLTGVKLIGIDVHRSPMTQSVIFGWMKLLYRGIIFDHESCCSSWWWKDYGFNLSHYQFTYTVELPTKTFSNSKFNHLKVIRVTGGITHTRSRLIYFRTNLGYLVGGTRFPLYSRLTEV